MTRPYHCKSCILPSTASQFECTSLLSSQLSWRMWLQGPSWLPRCIWWGPHVPCISWSLSRKYWRAQALNHAISYSVNLSLVRSLSACDHVYLPHKSIWGSSTSVFDDLRISCSYKWTILPARCRNCTNPWVPAWVCSQRILASCSLLCSSLLSVLYL